MSSKQSILVVGSVALDSVETPSASRTDVLGGSASFFATAASLLSPVGVVAVVGEDFPAEHVQFLQKRDIDLAGLTRAAGRTFRWSGRYLPNMVDRVSLDTQLNVFASFDPKLPDTYRDADYVFLANIDPKLQQNVLRQIGRPKFVALDTMNFWLAGEAVETLKQVIAEHLDVLFVNDEEAKLLSGCENLLDASAAILQMGAKAVVIKRGDAGAMLFDKDGVFWCPAVPVRRVVDPTGAGDTFAGGFVGYLAARNSTEGETLRQAMVCGAATASYVVEDFSVDRLTDVTRADLTTRCSVLADLVRFDPISL